MNAFNAFLLGVVFSLFLPGTAGAQNGRAVDCKGVEGLLDDTIAQAKADKCEARQIILLENAIKNGENDQRKVADDLRKLRDEAPDRGEDQGKALEQRRVQIEEKLKLDKDELQQAQVRCTDSARKLVRWCEVKNSCVAQDCNADLNSKAKEDVHEETQKEEQKSGKPIPKARMCEKHQRMSPLKSTDPSTRAGKVAEVCDYEKRAILMDVTQKSCELKSSQATTLCARARAIVASLKETETLRSVALEGEAEIDRSNSRRETEVREKIESASTLRDYFRQTAIEADAQATAVSTYDAGGETPAGGPGTVASTGSSPKDSATSPSHDTNPSPATNPTTATTPLANTPAKGTDTSPPSAPTPTNRSADNRQNPSFLLPISGSSLPTVSPPFQSENRTGTMEAAKADPEVKTETSALPAHKAAESPTTSTSPITSVPVGGGLGRDSASSSEGLGTSPKAGPDSRRVSSRSGGGGLFRAKGRSGFRWGDSSDATWSENKPGTERSHEGLRADTSLPSGFRSPRRTVAGEDGVVFEDLASRKHQNPFNMINMRYNALDNALDPNLAPPK